MRSRAHRLGVLALAVLAYELLAFALDRMGAGAVLLAAGPHTPIVAFASTVLLAVLRFALIALGPSVLAYETVSATFDRLASRVNRRAHALECDPKMVP